MTMVEPADRIKRIQMSGIRKMFEGAGPDDLNLGLGEPDFDPPEHVLDAYDDAIRRGENGYGPTAGLPELRAAIAEVESQHDPRITSDHVIVTAGATAALYATAQTFVSPGDEVLVPDPGFVLYGPHVELAHGTPVRYPLRADAGYEPDLDEVQELVTEETSSILVNSPGNPTGRTFDEDTVRGLVEIAEDHDLLVVSDEAYDVLTYEGEHVTFLGRSPNVLYVNTFSKRYAMTGWRLGYVVADPERVQVLRKMTYYMMACPPTPTQHAALAAVKGSQDFVDDMAEAFRARRDLMVEGFRGIPGFKLEPPEGAFYAFPRFDFEMTSEELAHHLLEAGVVTVPGSAFGPHGEGHIRLSYANDEATLEEALQRIEKAVQDLPRS